MSLVQDNQRTCLLGWGQRLLVSIMAASLCMNFVDRPLALASQNLAEPILRLAQLMSAISDPIVVLPVLGIVAALTYPLQLASGRYLCLRRAQPANLPIRCLFVSAVLATMLSLAFKYGLGRARPGYSDGLGQMAFFPFALEDGLGSLPSTHCAIAGAVAISLGALRAGWRAPLLQAGFCICLSRALLLEHWSSDAVLGWALGATVALAVARVASSALPFVTHRR